MVQSKGLLYQASSTNILVPGFQHEDSSTRILVLGFQNQASSTRILVLGFQCQDSHTRFIVLGFQCQGSGTKVLVLDFQNQDSSTRSQVLESWYQNPSTRRSLVAESSHQNPNTRILILEPQYKDLFPTEVKPFRVLTQFLNGWGKTVISAGPNAQTDGHLGCPPRPKSDPKGRRGGRGGGCRPLQDHAGDNGIFGNLFVFQSIVG